MNSFNTRELGPMFTSDEIVELFYREVVRVERSLAQKTVPAKPDVVPLPLADYADMCHEIAGKEILPDALLTKMTDMMSNDTQYRNRFPEGYKFLLAVVPFSNRGEKMTKEDISKGYHIRHLLIDKNGSTAQGFTQEISGVSQLLPPEMQALAFDLGPYDPQGLNMVPNNETAALVEKYKQAYAGLKALLK